jgi:hypothetical protein
VCEMADACIALPLIFLVGGVTKIKKKIVHSDGFLQGTDSARIAKRMTSGQEIMYRHVPYTVFFSGSFSFRSDFFFPVFVFGTRSGRLYSGRVSKTVKTV